MVSVKKLERPNANTSSRVRYFRTLKLPYIVINSTRIAK